MLDSIGFAFFIVFWTTVIFFILIMLCALIGTGSLFAAIIGGIFLASLMTAFL